MRVLPVPSSRRGPAVRGFSVASATVEIIYLHGFNSSPRSSKALRLGAALASLANPPRYHVPELPHRPAAAFDLAARRLAPLAPGAVTLVGSSLGGYYATALAERFGCRAVLINPTIRAHLDLRPYLGAQRNLHSGEPWVLTPGHLDELAALATVAPTDPSRYLLMVETGDEVLDYRLALPYYHGAWQFVRGGGDHGFQSFDGQIQTILRFAGWRPEP